MSKYDDWRQVPDDDWPQELKSVWVRKREPTGKWELDRWFDSNRGSHGLVIVDPEGVSFGVYAATDLGRSTARGYVDTYNMNEDKSPEFIECPYCNGVCSWCS